MSYMCKPLTPKGQDRLIWELQDHAALLYCKQLPGNPAGCLCFLGHACTAEEAVAADCPYMLVWYLPFPLMFLDMHTILVPSAYHARALLKSTTPVSWAATLSDWFSAVCGVLQPSGAGGSSAGSTDAQAAGSQVHQQQRHNHRPRCIHPHLLSAVNPWGIDTEEK